LPDSVLKFSDVSKKEHNEDERRLFYVALTRAKKQVVCSYPDSIVSENKSQSTIASMFLHEIADYAETIDAKSLVFADKEREFLEKIVAPKVNKYSVDADIAFYQELVNDFKLSVTALNDYLRDPEFFVTYRLLRVPQAKPAFLAYGSAMHTALEKLFRSYMKEQAFLDKEQLLSTFEQALKKELLLPEEFNRRLTKGVGVLDQYYQHIQNATHAPAFLERSFGNGFSQTILGDIHLLGRIDRIDWVHPTAKTVKVIDYKTGKVKSAREIEGLTVSANLSPREQSLPEGIRGPYKRQLLFYKLLSQLDKSFSAEVTHGSFEFLEPGETAQKFISREFELPQSEVELLKELIIQVMKEIRELEFLK
jgi:DNA helicase-2/ATP-dependent DNA helicase PcrA